MPCLGERHRQTDELTDVQLGRQTFRLDVGNERDGDKNNERITIITQGRKLAVRHQRVARVAM